MRTRRISTATAFAVLFSSVVLVGGAASPAAADSSRVLPIVALADIVTDGLHQRVFLSDPTSGTIVATDYSGKVVSTIASLPGVQGLELSPDSGTLYAAVPGADAIVAVDTATVKESARYDVGEGTRPRHPALAGGKLWFGYGPDKFPEPVGGEGDIGGRIPGDIGSLDLSGEKPVVSLMQNPDQGLAWHTAPILASTPGAPGALATVGGYGWSPVSAFDVTSGKAVQTGYRTRGGSAPKDIALSPDGKRVVVAYGVEYTHPVYRMPNLAPESGYAAGGTPNAVDIAPNGTVAVGSEALDEPNVLVYPKGAAKAVRTYKLANRSTADSKYQALMPASLSWAPDASRLFAVTWRDGTHSLQVLTDASRSVTSLKVDAPAKATRAKKLTATGKVTANAAFPAGSRVTVVRTDSESPKGKSLGSVALKSDGTFSFADTPPAGGKVTYKVTFAGNASHTPSSASDSVTVSRAAVSLKLDRNKSLHAYNKNVSFTATLGKTYKNRVVELWADPFGADKPKKLVKKAKVNSKGNLSVTVNMKRDTTVTAVFAGDGRYAPKTVKSTAYAKVNVSTKLSKHYKTAKIGKTSYAYYSKKKNPDFTTSMTYYKGRAQRLSLQIHYKGKWYDAGQQYFALGSNGKSVVTLTGPHDTGYKMRVRSSYVNSSSGDTVNSTTHGAWKYFIFTK
ncbi:YncE family protein [Streptomyces microflavus]|uniref:YncE family protein n=1 Tax=Streptomyces microflavus TaxID=1919 RepID=UPI0036AFDF03